MKLDQERLERQRLNREVEKAFRAVVKKYGLQSATGITLNMRLSQRTKLERLRAIL